MGFHSVTSTQALTCLPLCRVFGQPGGADPVGSKCSRDAVERCVVVSALTVVFDVLMADGEPRQKGECENHLRGWGFRNGSV